MVKNRHFKLNFMPQINPFLLLLLPLLFQIIFGMNCFADRIRLTFFKVSMISLFFQFVFSYLAFKIVSDSLRSHGNGEIRCGMPLVAVWTVAIFLIIILMIIILIQVLIKKYHKTTSEQ
jgi:heme/copper-type cytochrome/quinol oxidase subunit 2